jgi:hypothetical protein
VSFLPPELNAQVQQPFLRDDNIEFVGIENNPG